MPVPSPAGRAVRPPRDIDSVIRELQRINLSKCMDRLQTDIGQLSDMERWTGLYVRCPGPEPEDLGIEPPSSGYSTGSGSPPVSQEDACAGDQADVYAETEVKRPIGGGENPRGILTNTDRQMAHHCQVRMPEWRSDAECRDTVLPRAEERYRVRGGALVSEAGLAGFRPAAASTPRQVAPRSPKTLRFAATAELIAADSPCRQKVAAAAPRHGILRTAQPSAGAARSPVQPRRQEAAEPGQDGSERIRRALCMLRSLESDVSRNCSSAGTFGTAQFVSSSPPPRHPLEPLVVVTSSTDVTRHRDVTSQNGDLRDVTDFPASSSASPMAAVTSLGANATSARTDVTSLSESSEGDLVRWRRGKAPAPLRRSRRRLARLLSCTRQPSPSPLHLPSPPQESPSPVGRVLYQCNICGVRLPQHCQLVVHVHQRHRRPHVRPKYACGLCPARFFASRVLAKHCAHHHMGIGDKRTPHCLKVRRIV